MYTYYYCDDRNLLSAGKISIDTVKIVLFSKINVHTYYCDDRNLLSVGKVSKWQQQMFSHLQILQKSASKLKIIQIIRKYALRNQDFALFNL